jgi:hypothetical protein
MIRLNFKFIVLLSTIRCIAIFCVCFKLTLYGNVLELQYNSKD